MYNLPDVRWHVLNNIMSQHYVHIQHIFGLKGLRFAYHKLKLQMITDQVACTLFQYCGKSCDLCYPVSVWTFKVLSEFMHMCNAQTVCSYSYRLLHTHILMWLISCVPSSLWYSAITILVSQLHLL